MTYNWQQKDWTKFKCTLDDIEDDLFAFASKVGQTQGILKALQTQTLIDLMISEAIKTSEKPNLNLLNQKFT